MGDTGLVFEVKKSDWKQSRFAEEPVPSLAPGQVLFRVDRFALTANNISYALSGELLGYWRFFPCAEGWGRIPVMGFADSPRNAEFVRRLGCYDEVVLYDQVASLPKAPAVFVDMAGDGAVTAAVHRHFGDSLLYDCTIGATHWSADRKNEGLPGPKPEFFFAPAQIVKRSKEWGAQGLATRIASAWTKFCDASDAWLRVVRSQGRSDVERVYQDVLGGRTHPADGQILSL